MSKVLGFSDIESTQESVTGCSGAAISSFSGEGFRVARGFMISRDAIGLFLRSDDTRNALSQYVGACNDPGEDDAGPKEHLSAMILESRLDWSAEMEAITRFRDLDGLVSIRISTPSGRRLAPVFAYSESSFINGIASSIDKWLFSCPPHDIEKEMPALVIQEVVDAESSIEIKRKKDGGFVARAVFGLPEGLFDPAISSDYYHFNNNLELTSSEEKKQKFQHISGASGIQRVDVQEDFRGEPKASPEQLDSLISIMSYMLERTSISEVLLVTIDGTQLIMDIKVENNNLQPLTIRPREKSQIIIPDNIPNGIVSGGGRDQTPLGAIPSQIPDEVDPLQLHRAIEKVRGSDDAPRPRKPRTRLFVKANSLANLQTLDVSNAEGILLLGNWPGPEGIEHAIEEMVRLYPSTEIVVQLQDDEAWIRECLRAIIKRGSGGSRFSIMLPTTRTLKDHVRLISFLENIMPASSFRPLVWASLAYPSNLFFVREMTRDVDVISADLESLAMHLTGRYTGPAGRYTGPAGQSSEHGLGQRYDDHAMKEALSHFIDHVRNSNKKLAIHTPGFAGNPALLESLIRREIDIMCISRDELELVNQIARSLEAKVIAERGQV